MEAIPHRHPMLLIDSIEVLEHNKMCIGTYAVTGKEDFFLGHFPGYPVMPGFLIFESMSQAASAMLLSTPEFAGKAGLLRGTDTSQIRIPVVPGDVLKHHIRILRIRNETYGKFDCVSYVNGEEVASAVVNFFIGDKP
ncbi:3-hydroxyacyl-ACP dehydratase FabZ, partial [Patescibacteria group bacterium]|nr:3-hydroxyacyl-ACP dehydratase FabZ [Patescibacteria group bacterium]